MPPSGPDRYSTQTIITADTLQTLQSEQMWDGLNDIARSAIPRSLLLKIALRCVLFSTCSALFTCCVYFQFIWYSTLNTLHHSLSEVTVVHWSACCRNYSLDRCEMDLTTLLRLQATSHQYSLISTVHLSTRSAAVTRNLNPHHNYSCFLAACCRKYHSCVFCAVHTLVC